MLSRIGMRRRGFLPLFVLSLLAGAPSGARLYAGCDKDDCAYTELIAACSVIGPMFICGAFCSGMLKNAHFALPILLAQYTSAFLMFLRCRRRLPSFTPESVPAQSFSSAFCASVYSAVTAMLSIGGVILFFRVLLSLAGATWNTLGLTPLAPGLRVLLTGMLEVVNGCALLVSLSLSARQFVTAGAFLFSFSGVCIMMQSMQFYALRPIRYLLCKLVQGSVAALIAYVVAPLFSFGAQPVFYSPDIQRVEQNTLSALSIFLISLFAMTVVYLWCVASRCPKNKLSDQ